MFIRNNIFLFSIVLLSLLSFVSADSDVPLIEVQPSTHHLGKVSDQEKVEFTFKITNHSTEDIKIKNVRTSCGCTVVKEDLKEIKAGQSSNLTLKFDPTGRKGYSLWEILIYTSSSKSPVIMASFDTTILHGGIVSHDFITFGKFPKGTKIEELFWISPRNFPGFKINKIKLNLNKKNCFDIKHGVKEYEGFYPGKRKAHYIKIATKKDIPYGRIDGNLEIYSNLPGKEKIEIPLMGFVIGDIGTRPSNYIYMGVVEKKRSSIKRAVVFHRLGGRFKIKKIESTLPFIAAGFVPILEEQCYQVFVSIKKNAMLPVGEFSGKLIIHTTYKKMPKVVIPVKGVVAPPKK